jgi:hypothetical protein
MIEATRPHCSHRSRQSRCSHCSHHRGGPASPTTLRLRHSLCSTESRESEDQFRERRGYYLQTSLYLTRQLPVMFPNLTVDVQLWMDAKPQSDSHLSKPLRLSGPEHSTDLPFFG